MEHQLILDRYRPLEELGEGAFGSVVAAWDPRMQRRVAIKRLPLPLDSRGRPHAPAGLAEARTAAMLNHPSIVAVYDFDTDADEAFLVMEHVDGASLADLLDDLGGPLDADEAAAVLGSVADAVQFAHDNGVLHLDIKPSNVLVTRDGRVKVADFGIAELSTPAGHGAAWGGTPGYMPLEQLSGQRVSERTDEWALAALAYEMLTGDNPFWQPSVEEALVRLEVLDVPPASSYEPSLTREVDEILFAALGPRPADRYPSVEAFAAALLPHLGDESAGRASLAELVDAYAEEEPAEGRPGLGELGMWDRLQGARGSALIRLVAALESGWLAWAGLAPLGLESLALASAVGLVTLAAALAPALGTGLGLACFAVGLLAARAWILGSLFAVGVMAWWWFVARRSPGAAVIPLAAPVLGVVRLAPLSALLAGFSLTVGRAAAAGLVGGLLAMLASAASASGPPYLVTSPRLFADVWGAALVSHNLVGLASAPALIALFGWPVAAAVMSAFCSRATRLGAVAGAFAGSAVLLGGYLLASVTAAFLGATTAWFGASAKWAVGGSLILMLLVTALGPPIRVEMDAEDEL